MGKFTQRYCLSFLERQYELMTAAGIAVVEIGLHDSQSWCLPQRDGAVPLGEIRRRWPEVKRFHFHMHNARGMALPSIYAALRNLGPRSTRCSSRERWAESAAGNTAGTAASSGMAPTEDLMHMLEGMGIDTGVNLDRIIDCVWMLERPIGRPAFGLVSKAGPRPATPDALYDPNMPGIESLEAARHFKLGPGAYEKEGYFPWPKPISGPFWAGARKRRPLVRAGEHRLLTVRPGFSVSAPRTRRGRMHFGMTESEEMIRDSVREVRGGRAPAPLSDAGIRTGEWLPQDFIDKIVDMGLLQAATAGGLRRPGRLVRRVRDRVRGDRPLRPSDPLHHQQRHPPRRNGVVDGAGTAAGVDPADRQGRDDVARLHRAERRRRRRATSRTKAVKDGGDYLISGEKTSITFGRRLEGRVRRGAYRQARAQGHFVLSACRTNLSGVKAVPFERMGQRLDRVGSFFFDEVRIPACYMIGKGERGASSGR